MSDNERKLEGDYVNSSLAQGRYLAQPMPGEEVVISGMAGTFPASENVHHFMENLFNKVDMITGCRWDLKHPDIPPRCGIIPEIDKLDLGFFGWHHGREALEPSIRVLAERVIEAIFDAGLNPSDLEYTRTGIFNATCFSENDMCVNYGITRIETIMDCGRAPPFSKLSQYLKLIGPNFIIDTACSSSLFALEHAFRAIRSGEIDAAIVTGTNLVRHPYITLQFYRLGVLSPNSTCKVFDTDADGYVRSETVGAILLQKKKCAKRIYAELINAKTNCDGFKEDGITFPSSAMQKELLQEFYEECQIDPTLLSFMEAHGTGTRVGDPEESLAIDEFFTKGRQDTLLIGSVKSNIGHSEPSSGICSVIKSIIAMETGFIPPNINFKQPRQEIKGISEGRMTVVTDKIPFNDNRGLIGINSFGFGGANCHVLLKKNFKEKNPTSYVPDDGLPRLVCVSGRTRAAVHCLLDGITFDTEHIGLIHNIFRKNIQSHVHRGYTILDKSGEIGKSTHSCFTNPKQFYIVFGELNNAFEIVTQLIPINIFSETIQNIEENLLLSGVKVVLLKPSENLKNSILYKLAVQIAMVNIFKLLEVNIEEVVGYSYGTLASAYYNESVTLQEVLNCAIILDNILLSNSEEMKSKCIVALAHKLPEKSSLSDYFFNSACNRPNIRCSNFKMNALVLNIGNVFVSHINEDIDVQSIFSTQNQNHVLDLLNILGELYCNGQNPQISELYPRLEYPVGRGTKMISPYIKWNHKKDLFTLTFTNKTIVSCCRTVVKTSKISNTGKWSFISGHVIDGRNLFPATGYLRLVWELFADQEGMEADIMKIVFEDCRFLRATTIPVKGELKLRVAILRNGYFEVTEGESPVVTGRIYIDSSVTDRQVKSLIRSSLELKSKDVYKELRLRGYNYNKGFRGIQQCDINATEGLIRWEDNWITLMDNMLQMAILQSDSRSLYVPTYISKLNIDAKRHIEWIADNYKEEDKIVLPVFANPINNDISCGYIRIMGLLATQISIKKDLGIPVLEKYQFVSNCADLHLIDSVRVNSQIILENTLKYDIKSIELIDEFTANNSFPLSSIIKEVFEDQPLINPTIKIFSDMDLNVSLTIENDKLVNASDCTLIIASNLLQRKEIFEQAIASLQDNGFIISRESVDSSLSEINDSRVTVVTNYRNSSERIIMLKKIRKSSEPFAIQINSEDNFEWIDKVKDVIQSRKHDNVILYSEEEPMSGILGLVNCLRREPESSHLRCFFIMDKIEGFKPEAPFFKQQLDKNLAINIFKDGSWGTYRHLLLNQSILTESEHCEFKSLVAGDMSSLKWVETPVKITSYLQPEKVPVHINYCALNFKDIMVASGKIHSSVIFKDRLMQENAIGFEYSGKDVSGRRIAGMNVPALSTLVIADRNLCFQVPDNMTLEEAATIPAVYGTVLYGLISRAQLKRGCSILIHSATGGIGQAAIRIALSYDCKIFATVGTAEKRQFIKNQFPNIKDSHIGNSRDTSFEQMIYRETNGRGVDVVLNSLAEDKLLTSVNCLAKGGKFLEIGKFDLSLNNELSLLLFLKRISFHGVMFDGVFNETPAIKQQIMNMIEGGIRNQIIKPLNTTVFESNEAEQAFRYMMTGKHMGKVLIKIKPEIQLKCSNSDLPSKNVCLARYLCNSEKTYVILGGLGGFGLELADWLILRGARKLVLCSRSGVTTGYQKYRLKIWSSYGVLVHISQNNIYTKEGCEALLTESERLGSVEAIFNLAVVLADAMFENQTIDSFKTSFNPKAVATKYLDEISRRLCPFLRDFVIFSSVSCGRGNSGQTNYGMANSVMERICELRRKEGFPAVAIQWGAIGDVGLVAEMQEDHTILEIGGTLQQKIASCLNVLDIFLTQRESVIVSSMVVAEKRKGGSEALNVVEAVTSLIGINDLSSVGHHSTLVELGMDSMVGVEIKQILERDFGTFLTAKEIKTLTIARLKEIDDNLNQSDDSHGEAKAKVYGYSMFKEFSEEICRDITITKFESSIEKNTSTDHTVFIFPGIEGNLIAMKDFAKQINAQIYFLTYTSEIAGTSLDDLVNVVKPLVKEKLSNKSFKFVAHSFGGIVALEVATQLESEGYSGKIFLIDSSPSMLKRLTAAIQLKFGTDLETAVLCEVLQIYYKLEEVLTLKDTLQNCGESKINVFTELLRQKSHFKPDLIPKIARGLIQRSNFSQSFQTSFNKIGAALTLVRASEMEAIDDRYDYGLADIAQLPVAVHVVRSNHSSILEKSETIQLLNDWICLANN